MSLFIDVDRARYVSVGFNPSRDYLYFVEFGDVRKIGSTFIILVDQQVNILAECLPRICDSMCGKKQYMCKEGDFRLNTIETNGVARLYLEKQHISLNLANLQYFREIFHVVQNQLNVYTLCLPDVLSYVTVALTSANYVEPAPSASRHIIPYIHIFRRTQTIM